MPVHMHDSLRGGMPARHRLRAMLGVYIDDDTGAVALTSTHDVVTPEGEWKPRLTGGYPLTREQSEILAHGILGGSPIRAVLPANVLCPGSRLAWWVPSARRRIWFDAREQKPLQHVSRQEVLHPPLVFLADPGRIHVFALAQDARPDEGTALYQAPYLNVYEDGWCCGGTVQWPKSTAVVAIPQWESAFFDGAGTKVWSARLTRFPGGHNALWTAMLTAERFPLESLVPAGLTLLDALNAQRATSYPQPPPREVIIPALKEINP
jgi:PRTRC genetic system protein B